MMEDERILFKTAIDLDGNKIGKITRIFSPYETPNFEEDTHADITPLKRKYNNLAIRIELTKILHLDEKCVCFDITEKEFIEKAVRKRIEKEKQKKADDQKAKLDRLKKQAENIKKGYYNRQF
ncbi:MAG TPA: hypothetical protein VMX55_09695 [candidate division Zixibacteria bacterium]|nr:hypothetical protein [candidate division Zixibacteria bacterium]